MDQLAQRGICGLRYDSRGAGSTKYGPDVLDEGLQVLIDDAAACLSHLRARPEVDPRRVSVIGHSQGGSVALALVKANPGLSSIVLMATPGRRIDHVMADQIRGEGERRGLDAQLVARQLAELEEVVQFAQAEADWTSERVPPRLRSLARSRRWFSDHLRLSVEELLHAAAVPVLICQGGKDLQISVERDAQQLYASARDAGLEADLRIYPELDHLFKPVTGEPSLNQYFDRGRHVDGRFIADVADWLSRH
jgi:alpha-beta hydrolase superfamily lysophospholipase